MLISILISIPIKAKRALLPLLREPRDNDRRVVWYVRMIQATGKETWRNPQMKMPNMEQWNGTEGRN